MLYPAELPGLGSRGLDKRLVSWGTCIIPHTFYASTKKKNRKIFVLKLYFYFLYAVIKGIKPNSLYSFLSKYGYIFINFKPNNFINRLL